MDIILACESLNGAWETGSHSRVHGGCHVSTFSRSRRDNFIGIRAPVFLLNFMFYVVSPMDIGILNSLKNCHLNFTFGH